MKSVVASLQNVGRTFVDGERRREVLRGIDLQIHEGEMVALVGPSGCGKTTLLSIMGALDGTFDGELTLLGDRLRGLDDDARARLRNERIGFVFQAFHLLEHLSVGQNVEVPSWLLPVRLPRTEERARAKAALETVGLGDRLDEPVSRLSGGERQRVAVARAIVNQPRLLLADEPTGNLDQVTGEKIYELFDHIRSGDAGVRCAVVVATHDIRLAQRADRTVRMVDGRLEASATTAPEMSA